MIKAPIQIKDKVLGGGIPLITMPFVGKTLEGLKEECQTALEHLPDLVEWRADYFEGIGEPAKALEGLNTLNDNLGGIPILFTLRSASEGGAQVLEDSTRYEVIEAVVQTGLVSLVDIEAASPQSLIEPVRALTRAHGVALILSNHDFKATPEPEEMVNRLLKAQALGADIVKLAVMPQSREDVLNLMLASVRYNDLPDATHAVTISMSGDGLITRLAAAFSHSVITFCAGKGVSAPGQVPAEEMRGPMGLLARHLK